MDIKRNINGKLYIFLIIITMLFLFFEYLLLEDYYYNVDNNEENVVDQYEGRYKTIISSYKKLADAYYDEIVGDEEIINNFDLAYMSGELNRKISRDYIYDKLYPMYEDMVEDNFRQVHFVFPDNISFLRMHKANLYGDDLTDIRETVRLVNESKKFMQGFEEGRIYNGYRYEYPLFNRNKYIGCFEASVSYLSVIESADKLFDIPSFFMMRKSIVDDKVIHSEIENNYVSSKISDNYYYDREAYDYVIEQLKYSKFIDQALKDKKKIAEVALNLENHRTFVIHSKFEKKYYSIVFLEIKNILNDHSGYLIFINTDPTYGILRKGIIIRTILILMIYFLVVIFLCFYRKYKMRINDLLIYDSLTGAYNRKKMYKDVNNEIENFKRYGDYFSMIMLDIDDFKKTNDDFGYINADNVLIELSDVIYSKIRATDYLYRFAGDEFIVLLTHTDIEAALLVAEKLRISISEKKDYIGFVSNITVSSSVVEYRKDDTLEDILEKLNVLLSNAKKLGKNRVEYI